MAVELTSDTLSKRTKLIYGSGDFGFALTDSMIGVMLAIFLVDVVGLNPGLAAAAIFIGRSVDYINDPLVGYISDRTRTKWGRRRPFLLFGFLPYAILFAMLWWRPPFESQVWLAVYYGAIYALYDTAATILYMPYYALTPELTQNYDERTSLTSYRMAFSLFGTMIAFTIPLAVIGTLRPENAGRILAVAAVLGFFSAMPQLLVFFGTREKSEYMNMAEPELKDSIKAAYRNKPFLIVMGIFLFTWMALEIIQSTLLFFLKYRMNLESESDLITATIFITALIFLPFWSWVSGRWDKRTAYIAGMIYFCIVLVALIFIEPSWGMAPFLVIAVMAGIGISAVQVLPWAMIPDAVEWDELSTGERHEGMFYSLVTLFRKIAVSVVVPLALLVLQATGYVSNAAAQPTSAINGIRILMGPIPVVLLVVGVGFAFFYPLNRQNFAKIRSELAARRAIKESGLPD
jgi:glycoside/pentoside/hexuronide:cation symporter, GPH family